MKIVHFLLNNVPKYGSVYNDKVKAIEGNIFKNFSETKNLHDLSSLKFLPPVFPTVESFGQDMRFLNFVSIFLNPFG